LKINRYRSFNGFICWFDCEFTQGHEVITLSTSKLFSNRRPVRSANSLEAVRLLHGE
jgi:hypothetical protein